MRYEDGNISEKAMQALAQARERLYMLRKYFYSSVALERKIYQAALRGYLSAEEEIRREQ